MVVVVIWFSKCRGQLTMVQEQVGHRLDRLRRRPSLCEEGCAVGAFDPGFFSFEAV